MGKKQGDESDLMADFFGEDDLDWLDDGESVDIPASEPVKEDEKKTEPVEADAPAVDEARPQTLPVAPPPPPAFKPAPSQPEPVRLTPLGAPARQEPVAQASDAPSPSPTDTWDDLLDAEPPAHGTITPPSLDEGPSDAPPPADIDDSPAPEVEPTPEADERFEDLEADADVSDDVVQDAEPVQDEAIPAVEEAEEGPAEPEVASEELVSPAEEDEATAAVVEVEFDEEPEPEDDDPAMVTGDLLEATGQTPAPLVRTHDPAPLRSPAASATAGPSPGIQYGAPSLPPASDTGWLGMHQRLLHEADASTDNEALLHHAGHVALRRLGDPAYAYTLLQKAVAAGGSSVELLREYASLAIELEKWRDAEQAYAKVGELEEPLPSSEAWQEAAGAAAQQDDGVAVVRYLRFAAHACPTDVIALSLLRDQLPDTEEGVAERMETTRQLAALSPGAASAELWWQQAQELRNPDELAEEALRAVLNNEPDHTAAVIRLRNLLIARADHSGFAELLGRRAERATGLDGAWWAMRTASAHAIADHLDETMAWGSRAAEASLTTEPKLLANLADHANHAHIASVLSEDRGLGGDELRLRRIRAALAAERAGNPSASLAMWRQDLQDNPDDSLATASVARLESLTGEGDPIAELRDALSDETDPARRRVRALALALALERSGDADGARALADELPGLTAGWLGYASMSASERSQWVRDARDAASDADERAEWNLLLALGCPDIADADSALAAMADSPSPVRTLVAITAARQASPEAWTDRVDALAAQSDDAGLATFASAARLAGGGDARASELTDEAARAVLSPSEASGNTPLEAQRSAIAQPRQDDDGLWWDIAAADVAQAAGDGSAAADWAALASDERVHTGALRSGIEAALANQDVAARLDALDQMLLASESDDDRAMLLVHMAEELASLGNRDGFTARITELLALEDVEAPWSALAFSAESLGEWRAAVDLLERTGGARARLDWARLVSGALADPASGLRLFRSLDADDVREASATRALSVARAVDDLDAMASAHAVLASGEGYESFRAAHAGWAADSFEELGESEQALGQHQRALALRPSSQTAFHGARRLTIHSRDSEALRDLHTNHSGDRATLAEDLEAIGDIDAARTVWTELAQSDAPLGALLALEQLERQAEDWPAVLAALRSQREHVRSAKARASIDNAIVSLLGEHLPDSDEAYETYGQLVQDNPDDRELSARYARMAGLRGETGTAVATLTRLAETASRPAEAASHKATLGDLLRETGDADGARQCYLDALDDHAGLPAALSGLRKLAEESGDGGALLAVLHQELASASDEERADKLAEVARTMAAQDDADPTAVMDAWRAVLDEDNRNSDAARELMQLAESAGDQATFDHAGTLLLDSLQGDERRELLRALGAKALSVGRRDAAQSWYEQAFAMQPADAPSAAALVSIYEGASNWSDLQKALTVLADASEPQDAARYWSQAAEVALRHQSDADTAAALYERVLGVDPEDRNALMFAADRAYRAGDYARAAAMYDRVGDRIVGERDLDDFDDRLEASLLYYRYGVSLAESGRAADSQRILERALELDETHVPSLERLAPLYRRAGEFDKASDAYRRMLQVARSVGDKARVAAMYVELGLVDHAQGENERAAKRFGKALDIDAHNAPALLGMALIYEDQEQYDNCWKSYNAVIHNASNRDGVILAYLRKGRVLDERKERLDKAAEHYERCLEVEPEQAEALVRLAEILTRLDRPDDALSVVDRTFDLSDLPHGHIAQLHVIRALVAATRDEPAEAHIDAARAAGAEWLDELEGGPLNDLAALRLALRRRLPIA